MVNANTMLKAAMDNKRSGLDDAKIDEFLLKVQKTQANLDILFGGEKLDVTNHLSVLGISKITKTTFNKLAKLLEKRGFNLVKSMDADQFFIQVTDEELVSIYK